MVLPILAGGAAAGGAYWLMNKIGGKDEVDPYKPNKDAFNYEGLDENYFSGRAEAAGGRAAPKADYGKYEQGRMAQMEGRTAQGEAISHYRGMINNPNSFAQNQLRQASDANFRQQMAAGRSAGYNPAAMRAAMQTGGQIQAQTNQQAQSLQVQETNAAVQGLANAAMQQRAADLQLMGMDAQTAQYQAMLELQQGALNDKMQLGMYQLGQNASMAQLQAGMGYEGMLGGNIMAAQGANAQSAASENAAMWGMIGTGMSAGAAYGAGGGGGGGGGGNQQQPPPSDERSKQQIQELKAENGSLRNLMAELGGRGRTMATDPVGSFTRGAARIAEAASPTPTAERKVATYLPEGSYFQPDMKDEGDVARAEAAFRRENAEALRRQAAAESADMLRMQRAEQERVKAVALEQAYRQAYDPRAYGGDGAAGAPSDERSKQRIQELEGIVDEYRAMTSGLGQSAAARPELREPMQPPAARFADIPAKRWEYGAEPFASQYPGEHIGPTTKDLKANPATAGAVYTGPDGFERPEPTLLGLSNTAAIAEMARIQQEQEERLRAYEQMSGGRPLPDAQMQRFR